MPKSSLPGQSLAITAARFARLAVDPALRERRTTSDYIVDALRAAIYDGQFADGEELNQVGLAGYFKVSRVPIREALRQLHAEGLVSNIAHRRTLVIGLDLSEILELIEIRAVVEGHLVAKAGPPRNTGASWPTSSGRISSRRAHACRSTFCTRGSKSGSFLPGPDGAYRSAPDAAPGQGRVFDRVRREAS